MAMAVASARYESEDAYRIDYREFFFFATNLSSVSYLFFFLSFFTAQHFSRFDQRVQTERSCDFFHDIYISIFISKLVTKKKKKKTDGKSS